MNSQGCPSEAVVATAPDRITDELADPWLNKSKPQVGFYRAGRLANAFAWNLTHAFLLASRSHFAAAEIILNSLTAAMFALPLSAPEQLVKQMMAARDTLRDAFRSETHFDLLTSEAEEYRAGDRWSRDVYCRRLYNGLVEQHVERVREILVAAASDRSDCEAAFRLGLHIDQGVRRADVYEYLHTSAMAAHRRVEPTEAEENETADEQRPAWAILADTERKAGELPPDAAWADILTVLCGQIGLSPDLLREWLPTGDHDASDVRSRIASIDERVDEHLQYSELRRKLASGEIKPVWDDVRRQLRVGHVVLKDFSKNVAKNQSAILAAFQEEGWPEHIYDPITPDYQQNSKRKLVTTVGDLNKTLKIDLIRFYCAGTGEGVRCEPVQYPHSD